MLRPGRLDKTLYVGVPTLEDRVEILRTITRNGQRPVLDGVDLENIASQPRCNGYRYIPYRVTSPPG